MCFEGYSVPVTNDSRRLTARGRAELIDPHDSFEISRDDSLCAQMHVARAGARSRIGAVVVPGPSRSEG